VAALLAAAAAPAERPVPGEVATLAAYRDAMAIPPVTPVTTVTTVTSPTPRSRMQSRTTVKLAAASAIGVLSLVGSGYAVAATGSLPGSAQQTAKDALASVGVTVPGPADAAADETATREGAATTGAAASAADAETGTEASARGDAVSDLATTTDLAGADKGAAVSGLASDGRSRAGARPTPTATTTTAAAETDDVAGSAATGEQASDGRSTAGAGNADPHRP
jgi:hypothetical protein